MKYQNSRDLKVGIFKFIIKGKRDFQLKDSIKLRGCILNNFNERVEYHNHLDEYSFNYQSPLVQYKIIDGNLAIVVLDEMLDVVKGDLEKLELLKIGKDEYTEWELDIDVKEVKVEVGEELFSYDIKSPWLALNQENYPKYKNNKFDLSLQLRNNIIEFFGGIDLFAQKKVIVKGVFNEETVKHKENILLGFNGSFISNVKLPDYISLGKRKSLGFGMIKLG